MTKLIIESKYANLYVTAFDSKFFFPLCFTFAKSVWGWEIEIGFLWFSVDIDTHRA